MAAFFQPSCGGRWPLCLALVALLASDAHAATTVVGGTGAGSLFRFNVADGSASTLNAGDPVPSGITALARDPGGILFGGNADGDLLRFSSDGATFARVLASPPLPGGLSALSFDATGLLWAASPSGTLLTIDPLDWSSTTLPLPVGTPPLTALSFAPDGTLWAGNEAGDLARVNRDTLAITVLHNLPIPLHALTFDASGTLLGASGVAGNVYSIDLQSGTTRVLNPVSPVPGGVFGLAIPESSFSLLLGASLFILLVSRRAP